MGKVRRLLFSKQLDSDAPRYYADKRAIETAESLHVHERNLRLEYSADEFGALLLAVQCAEQAWDGSEPKPDAPTKYLDVSDLDPAPAVTPSRFDVEESEYPTLDETTVHVHYRSLRMELSHDEWREFAEGIVSAWGQWCDSR